MEKLFEELEFLIFHSKIDELAIKLIPYLNEKELHKNKSEVILLGNRYNKLNKDKHLRLISHENFSVEQAQIVYGFINMIDELKKQHKKSIENIIVDSNKEWSHLRKIRVSANLKQPFYTDDDIENIIDKINHIADDL